MNSTALYEQLDRAVEKIFSGEPIDSNEFEPLVNELLPVATDLQLTPRPKFRAALLSQLEEPHVLKVVTIRREAAAILPTLFGVGYQNYPVQHSNFVVSAAMHAAAIALLFTSSLWLVRHKSEVKLQSTALLTNISPYLLPESSRQSGGGGGGGDHDKLQASKGDAPRFAREQITPPAIVVRNNDPKLQVEPTVVGPPTITLSKLGNTGDPLNGVLAPASNGTGSGAGIGSGSGGGVGDGIGAGVGSGVGGGFGGGVFRVGGKVSAPRAIYDPEPQYTDEARKSKIQGVVMLAVVIGPDGRAHDFRVSRSLGMGLDEKAIETVRTWKFEPARKDGQPVAVLVNIEVNFRLY
jgi:protein TonB